MHRRAEWTGDHDCSLRNLALADLGSRRRREWASGAGRFWVGDDVWWLEGRPGEGGRYAVRNAQGDLLPAPWNDRSRVHEYGGGAGAVTADRALVFVEFSDQRRYRLDDGASTPVPLTPAGRSFRFGDIGIRGSEVIAAREAHTDGAVARDIVAVELDGGRLAWIGWEHPQMPWDGTELRVTDLETGALTTLAGSVSESVLQPEWVDDFSLTMISDPGGWWNLHSVSLQGEVTVLHHEDAEFGGPLGWAAARSIRGLSGEVTAHPCHQPDTPVLLLQGRDDEIVPPAQAELFRDALAAKGLPHACLAYEPESHGFRRAETIIDAIESELSFYGQTLGFEPPGVPRLSLS